MGNENVVALCDADLNGKIRDAMEIYPQARVYQDFRKMFDEMGSKIDPQPRKGWERPRRRTY